MTQTGGWRVAWWALVVALTAATLGGAALGGWQLQVKSQPPPADQPADRQAATQAASNGTVKLLSYSADTLDQDFSAAEAVLTGDFLATYKQFTQIIRPAAQKTRMTTTARVVGAAVGSLTSQQAVILVFVDQTTSSQDKPSPTTASSSVNVSLSKVNGTWLIAKFDPV
jgi:Mce-associated membrane protein